MRWYDNNTIVLWFVVLAVLLTISLGCQKQVVLHPIEKSDIFFVPKDAVIVLDPNSTDALIVEKDGWFLSEVYVQEVMEVKIE